jgi:hypothetical protein
VPVPAGIFTRTWRYLFGSNNRAAEQLVQLPPSTGSLRVADLSSSLSRIEKSNKKIEKKLNESNQKIEVSMRATAALALRNFNAYRSMTQTSAGINKVKQEELRKRFYFHCQYSDKPAVENGTTQAVCALSGRVGRLKLAHLVPASAPQDIRDVLKMPNNQSGIWSVRNVLLLGYGIEDAFDHLRISFSAHPLRSGVFYMKVWDEAVRAELIFDEAKVQVQEGDNTIGYYEGVELKLALPNGVQLVPFKRALSYQEFLCFAYSTLPTRECPNDFSSDIGDQRTQKRSDLLVLRNSLEKEIQNEADSEVGESD